MTTSPPASGGQSQKSWPKEGKPGPGHDAFWSVKAVNARQAEYAGLPLEPACPVCGGLGVVKDPATADTVYIFGQIVPCPVCSEPSRRRWLAANCGLEGPALDVRLAHWSTGFNDQKRKAQRETAWLAINKATKHRAGLLTFWGDFGSGKTHALSIVCNELRDQLVETYYAPLAVILDHLRALYAQGRDTSEYWRRLLDIPALALDEITRINATPWASEKLFVLVDTRYRRRKSHLTLFATNDNPNKPLPSTDALGYLYSRMREGGLVELRGDMRPAVKAEWWNG